MKRRLPGGVQVIAGGRTAELAYWLTVDLASSRFHGREPWSNPEQVQADAATYGSHPSENRSAAQTSLILEF